MDKKAEGNLKSFVFGIVVFSLILGTSVGFFTILTSEYSKSVPVSMGTLSKEANKSLIMTDEMSGEMARENRSWAGQLTDRLMDGWMGGIIKPVTVVYDSTKMFTDFGVVLLESIGLDTTNRGYILGQVMAILFLISFFAFIYFIRSGK